jgi:XapX domain-containing protein
MLYLILGVGVLVGIIYSLLNVRACPPLVALVGLLGMLAGERAIPVGKRLLADSTFSVAWREAKCAAHMFGMLPGRHADEVPKTSGEPLMTDAPNFIVTNARVTALDRS